MTFLEKHCVSSDKLCTRPLASATGAKILSRGDIFEFQIGSVGDAFSTPAYFLGHGDGNQTNPRPPYLEIPKVGGLVVTGNLTGGSFIVTEMKDRYRIFHDPRRNSSVYYDNIVMAVDFLDISGSRA